MTASKAHLDSVQRVLEERALALAKPPREELDTGATEVLMVRAGTERYGLAVGTLTEVRPLVDLTSVPGLPPLWAGLVSLRGVLYPVIDMPRYLGSEPTEDGDRAIVLVSSAFTTVGLLVQEIVGLRSVASDEIRHPLEADIEGVPDLVRGITDDFLLLLDTEALLDDARLVFEDGTT